MFYSIPLLTRLNIFLMKTKIPFNSFYSTGNEDLFLKDVINSGRLTGNGKYTKKCYNFIAKKYNFTNVLLTNSCTAALEMAAYLINIQHGDEVIIPSYTFVSTANAFALRGAKIVFADSGKENPNLDALRIEQLITKKTKAIVVVHYAGIACDMDSIIDLAHKYNLFVIEDAAHAIDSLYKNKPLGSFGHLATFSFHETKNITCGEGGMLVINDQQFFKRAEIIIEKGTNRKDFTNGKTKKYEWVDLGSSYRLPELSAAFLFSQLEVMNTIQLKRKKIWNKYYRELRESEDDGLVKLPRIPTYAKHNASIFYLTFNNLKQRDRFIEKLLGSGIAASFHYQPLHLSPFYLSNNPKIRKLKNAEMFGDCLVRLPLYSGLSESEVSFIIKEIKKILNK